MSLQIILHIFLAFVWMLLQNSFTFGHFLAGYVVGAIILYVFYRFFPGGKIYLSKAFAIVELLLVFLWELLKANITVANLVLSRKMEIRPGIIAVPLEITQDQAIALLANMITLTPGTLSLDVSADKKEIFVHVLNLDDTEAARREIKEVFERRIIKILEGRP